MRYQFTCLTPVLVGDGRRLSPIDYMVWKDHVNVLDQRRIFKLLSKGPRLESYLAQLRKAERLDFASWGGFAQNFAGRRIPFEDPSCTEHWYRARTENLHIPTFACGPSGPYLPASALKGALRSALLWTKVNGQDWRSLIGQLPPERQLRRPGQLIEEQFLGEPGRCLMRAFQLSDSLPAPGAAFKVYLLRVASLKPKGRDGYLLTWKQTPGGADALKPEEGSPIFAEMAAPGTTFEGTWKQHPLVSNTEIHEILQWPSPPSWEEILSAANSYAESLLDLHARFAELGGLEPVSQDLARLRAEVEAARQKGNACLVPLGWGTGFLARVAWHKTDDADYRQLLAQTRLFGKGPVAGFPFPKTRRVVFIKSKPACLPGWGLLEIQ